MHRFHLLGKENAILLLNTSTSKICIIKEVMQKYTIRNPLNNLMLYLFSLVP